MQRKQSSLSACVRQQLLSVVLVSQSKILIKGRTYISDTLQRLLDNFGISTSIFDEGVFNFLY